MKQLEEEFKGKGQVKGFVFTQLEKSASGYIYAVYLMKDVTCFRWDNYFKWVNCGRKARKFWVKGIRALFRTPILPFFSLTTIQSFMGSSENT